METAEALRIIKGIRNLYDSGIGIPCHGAVAALDVAIDVLERIKHGAKVDEKLLEEAGFE